MFSVPTLSYVVVTCIVWIAGSVYLARHHTDTDAATAYLVFGQPLVAVFVAAVAFGLVVQRRNAALAWQRHATCSACGHAAHHRARALRNKWCAAFCCHSDWYTARYDDANGNAQCRFSYVYDRPNPSPPPAAAPCGGCQGACHSGSIRVYDGPAPPPLYRHEEVEYEYTVQEQVMVGTTPRTVTRERSVPTGEMRAAPVTRSVPPTRHDSSQESYYESVPRTRSVQKSRQRTRTVYRGGWDYSKRAFDTTPSTEYYTEYYTDTEHYTDREMRWRTVTKTEHYTESVTAVEQQPVMRTESYAETVYDPQYETRAVTKTGRRTERREIPQPKPRLTCGHCQCAVCRYTPQLRTTEQCPCADCACPAFGAADAAARRALARPAVRAYVDAERQRHPSLLRWPALDVADAAGANAAAAVVDGAARDRALRSLAHSHSDADVSPFAPLVVLALHAAACVGVGVWWWVARAWLGAVVACTYAVVGLLWTGLAVGVYRRQIGSLSIECCNAGCCPPPRQAGYHAMNDDDGYDYGDGRKRIRAVACIGVLLLAVGVAAWVTTCEVARPNQAVCWWTASGNGTDTPPSPSPTPTPTPASQVQYLTIWVSPPSDGNSTQPAGNGTAASGPLAQLVLFQPSAAGSSDGVTTTVTFEGVRYSGVPPYAPQPPVNVTAGPAFGWGNITQTTPRAVRRVEVNTTSTAAPDLTVSSVVTLDPTGAAVAVVSDSAPSASIQFVYSMGSASAYLYLPTQSYVIPLAANANANAHAHTNAVADVSPVHRTYTPWVEVAVYAGAPVSGADPTVVTVYVSMQYGGWLTYDAPLVSSTAGLYQTRVDYDSADGWHLLNAPDALCEPFEALLDNVCTANTAGALLLAASCPKLSGIAPAAQAPALIAICEAFASATTALCDVPTAFPPPVPPASDASAFCNAANRLPSAACAACGQAQAMAYNPSTGSTRYSDVVAFDLAVPTARVQLALI